MSGRQTLYTVLLMLLLIAVSISGYVFYEQELYFSMFFSGVLVIVLIGYLTYSRTLAMRRLLRMVESIRYGDFSLSYSTN